MGDEAPWFAIIVISLAVCIFCLWAIQDYTYKSCVTTILKDGVSTELIDKAKDACRKDKR